MAERTPPSPSATACTASSSDSDVMTTSAPSTASAIVPASRAPAARTSSAWPFDRFHPTTESPPASGRRARAATSGLLDQPLMIDGYKAFMPAFADEFDDLAEVGTRPVTHEVVDGAPIGTRLELIPAAGHTPGDLMVLVDDSILFAGDVCFFGVTPLAFQGDPAAWVEVLGLVPDLASTIVPGHGPMGGLPEVGALRHHLAAGVD